MGNHALPFNLTKRHSHSRYSHIDRKSNPQQLLQSQIDQWDSSWKDVTHQNVYYRVQYGKLNTFRNDVTSQDVQRYRVVINDKNNFQQWKQMVHWRNNSPYLPKIEHFSLQNQGQVCVSQFQINLFIERIPLRLVDLTDIPYPENIYFLLCVLKGFKYIFSAPFPIKSFRVTESMICVNKEGEVKVWFNPNLSEFEPVNEKNTGYATQDEILRNLIDLVQQNTDQRDYPYPFKQYLSDRNIQINGDYNSIIQQLYTFAREMKVGIPKYAFSVRDILSKEFLSLNKIEEENSFSQKPHFRNQNSSLRRDQSLSVLNSFDFQQQKRQQLDFQQKPQQKNEESNFVNINDPNKIQFFPKQKTHGLIPINSIQPNNAPSFVPQLPPFKHNQIVNQPQTQMMHHIQPLNSLNSLNSYQNAPQNTYHQTNQSLTDRVSPNDNINGHLMKINKIGTNIIQYSNPSISYQSINPQPGVYYHQKSNFNPRFSPEKRQKSHSLGKMNQIQSNHFVHQIPPAPPGYRMVQKKIVHPVGYDPLKKQKIQNFNPSLPHYSSFKPQNQYQVHLNPSFKNIERVGSTRVPFSMTNQLYPIERNHIHKTIENDGLIQNLTQTKRPQKVSSTVQIQRINRQTSQRNFINNEMSQQNLKKANSFKNNLIKNQRQEIQVQRAVSNVKYFTKIDSEQTLDPQIAGDLMKYLGRQH